MEHDNLSLLRAVFEATEQVVYNILSNSVKFAPGSPIEVRLTKDKNDCVLRIRDYGPGIPTEKHQSIFGLFERASSMMYIAGLGVGLFISRSIAQEDAALLGKK